jgi:hypothetical protein
MSTNDSDDRADEPSSPAVQNEPDVNVKQEEEDDDELEQDEEEGSGEDELPEDEDEGEQEMDDDDEKDGNSAAGRAYFKIEDRVPPPTSVYRTIREIHGEHPRCIVVNKVSHKYAQIC